MATFAEILTAAINDMAENGYDSAERVAEWQRRLREAADAMLLSDAEIDRMLRESLRRVYEREVEGARLLRRHPGLSRFTLEQIKPKLRPELDRRIQAGLDLIKLNRKAAVESMQRRFAGWSTSIPKGGSDRVRRREDKIRIKKSLSQLPYEQRRLLTDQGHKLVSAINDIVSADGGAIAGLWHSHWREINYDYRPEHKVRDLKIYAVRGSWAMEKGLMAKGPDGYIDEFDRPAELPYCRCFFQYLYNLAQLPPEMITVKGAAALAEARARRMNNVAA